MGLPRRCGAKLPTRIATGYIASSSEVDDLATPFALRRTVQPLQRFFDGKLLERRA